ncbi:MAG: protein kinase domain-containing protein [Candidatus Aminicenantes bacterium]
MKCPKCHHGNPDDTLFCGKCGSRLSSIEDIDVTKTIETTKKEQLTAGSIIANRYEIIKELGKGGMGVVYRVADPLNPERSVALKSIGRKLVQSELIDRFKAEFRVLTSLKHPNVAAAFDFESFPGSEDYFYTMEFVEGRDVFRATEGVSWQQILSLLIQVCRALSYVHSRRIIHYDIKPGNVLVDNQGHVKVLDFGLAAVKSIGPGEWRGGTPAYMAPEQANPEALVDHRSDLYSLGIMAYQLFSKQLPFRSDSVTDLFRMHRFQPLGFDESEWAAIPRWLRSVIERLCAKHPADRYPTANAVVKDINHRGRLSYEVETIETRESYIFSSRFVGRRLEYEHVRDFLTRRTKSFLGSPPMLMVKGQSGTGKSRLMKEVRYDAQLSQVLFCQGRCIENNFSEFQPLVPVLEMLTRHVDKLGGVELIHKHGPELVKLCPSIGKTWGIEPSPALEQMHRERVRLQEEVTDFLIRAAALAPYIVYIDDLQWALSGLTELLAELARRIAIEERHDKPIPIVLLGTYREDEVSERPLEAIRDALFAEGRLEEMKLDPLGESAVGEMIGSMLGAGEPPDAFVDRIARETGGNPFFVEELMRVLVEHGAVRIADGSWQIKKAISEIAIPRSVAEALRRRIGILDDNQRALLDVLAVCGRPTAADVLAHGTELDSNAFHSALSQLVERRMAQEVPGPGFLVRLSHDRLRGIVYEDLEESVRVNLHLRMARSMEAIYARELDEHIFDIVDQYNFATELLCHSDERDKVAHYNELAGHRSKKEGAFEAAGKYFRSALALLPQDSWSKDYERTSAISKSLVEVEYLGKDLEQAERHWRTYVERARTNLDKVEAYIVKIDALSHIGELHQALDAVQEALPLLGVRYPARPKKLSVGLELVKAKRCLKGKTAEDLITISDKKNPVKQALFKLLSSAMAPAFMTYHENLLAFYVAKAVQLLATSTSDPKEPTDLAIYAHILQSGLGNIKAGRRIGELALQLLRTYDDPLASGSGLFLLAGFVFPWTRPLRELTQLLLEGHRESMKEGDLLYAGFNLNVAITQQCMYSGSNDETIQFLDEHEGYLLRLNNPHTIIEITALRQMLRQLSGQTKNSSTFDDDDFNEDQFLKYILEIDDPIPIGFYFAFKLKALFIMGFYEKAFDLTEEAGRRIGATWGQFVYAEHSFFHFLAVMRWLANVERRRRRRLLRDLNKKLKLMKKWAGFCPQNFEHKQLLMEAELARTRNESSKARHLYQEAVTSAHEAEFPLNAALGSELAGRFELEQGRDSEAATWLRNAREGYAKWGGHAKVEDMDEEFKSILIPG